MERLIIKTGDGSTTIRLPEWDECYHSTHGAIQEAQHVFIERGLALFPERAVSILEIGFGTGLNALMTFVESQKSAQEIFYTGVEGFPVSVKEALQMNYPNNLNISVDAFKKMHECKWETPVAIVPNFTLHKKQMLFSEIDDNAQYDLVYFDAFGFRVQPELWSGEIFRKMYKSLKTGGILVTYAARTIIKKNMEAAGFTVEKLAGPPGKREMMRGFKE